MAEQKEKKKSLEVGEKYLSLSVGGIKVGLFPNKNKKSDNSPDFVGAIPISCWVNKKKPQQENIPVEDIV